MSNHIDDKGGLLATVRAEFNQSRNDMHWSIYNLTDGRIRWTGYDDNNWWDNVSPTDAARNRTGKITGRIYRLDHETNEVKISKAASQ